MAATITDPLKRKLLDDLWTSFHGDSLQSSDSDKDIYYVGIGRGLDWPTDEVPEPYPDQETIRNFQSSMQAVKRVLDLSYVIPRYNWSAGSVYTAWSDTNHSDTSVGTLEDIAGSYYVITDDNNVYVCLQQGKTNTGAIRNSIYKPTRVDYEPFEAGPDGYVWKFLYNVGTYNSRQYLTSSWIPVEHILDSELGGAAGEEISASRLAQALIQRDAVSGEVLAIEVDSGGIGYNENTTITIHGDGVDAFAFPRVDDNGRIFQVVMKDSEGDPKYRFGSGYEEQTWVTVNGVGSGASLRPVVHRTEGGMGYDPRKDLNSSALMYSVRIIGDEYKIFNVQNDFRQVGLIRNLLKDSTNSDFFTGDSDFTGVRGVATKKLYVGSGIYADKTNMDNTVTGQSSGAVGIVDRYDTYVDSDCCDPNLNETHQVLYVYQTPETGFKPFAFDEVVELSHGAGAATIIRHSDSNVPALRYADVDAFSGEVFYVDNRIQIDRDEDQTEDIKIVIDL